VGHDAPLQRGDGVQVRGRQAEGGCDGHHASRAITIGLGATT
jgi:hypothetical protein